jgi:hypothetical protein
MIFFRPQSSPTAGTALISQSLVQARSEKKILCWPVSATASSTDSTESAIRRWDWIAVLPHCVINPAPRLTTNNRR